MTRPASVSRALVAAAAVVGASVAVLVGACDMRAALAQSSWFADARPELVDECCACLAARGTADVEATCTEAILVDGAPVVPDGAVFGAGGQDVPAREQDDVVDDGEVPCLCGGLDRAGCIATLDDVDGRLVVPGACLDRVDREAACEAACGGVLAFVPIAAAE